jgi:hypothetical protein
MYGGGSAPAYVPSALINEHNVYAPIGPAAWRPIAPSVPSVLMEVEQGARKADSHVSASQPQHRETTHTQIGR